jgi:rhodanese-related sulfurtransferase
MQTAVLALFLVLLVGVGALMMGRSRTLTAVAGGAPPAGATAATRVEHVDAPEAARLIERSNVTVLDLRTPEEHAVAHLAGAQLLNFNSPDFERELARLDRGRTYLVHCASGRRSTAALEKFRELGFQHVIHLDGGLRAWQAAGLPVVKDAPRAGR